MAELRCVDDDRASLFPAILVRMSYLNKLPTSTASSTLSVSYSILKHFGYKLRIYTYVYAHGLVYLSVELSRIWRRDGTFEGYQRRKHETRDVAT